MNIQELQTAIEAYPTRLATALDTVSRAEENIQSLKKQIADKEYKLFGDAPSKDEERLLTMEQQISLAEISIKQLEGKVEQEYRKSGEKVTEGTVAAYVKSHLDIIAARETLVTLKHNHDQLVLTMKQKKQYPEQAQAEELRSPGLEALRGHLQVAERTLITARNQLEEVKAQLVTYKLLVALATTAVTAS